MPYHLRIQLTLLPTSAGGRKNSLPAGEFRTVLNSGGHHFSAAIFPEEPVKPGGAAVHCNATFLAPKEALSHFPAGSQFELWEGGRKGYGSVLVVL